MTAVIVPNVLRVKIDRLLDELAKANPAAELFRKSLYEDFLAFYYEEGYLPEASDIDFQLAPLEESIA